VSSGDTVVLAPNALLTAGQKVRARTNPPPKT